MFVTLIYGFSDIGFTNLPGSTLRRLISRRGSDMKMSNGLVGNTPQKSAQSTVDPKQQSPPPGVGTDSMFRRAPMGSGTDERDFEQSDDFKVLENAKVLSKISRSFKQKDLLMELSSNYWSESEKIFRIQKAASEDILPSSMSSMSVGAANIQAGGLMGDWEFSL